MNKRQLKKNARKYIKLLGETADLYPPPNYLYERLDWKYFVKTARKRRISNDKKSMTYVAYELNSSGVKICFKINTTR